LVFVGVARHDDEGAVIWMAEKLAGLRIFEDEGGKMNMSVADAGGGMLLVSQFTLLGDCRRGKRPSFSGAAGPAEARRLYEALIREVAARGIPVAQGCFQADMDVRFTNVGPVTILLDSDKVF
jgi:D-tyrosyl-tRNA(Tyr) deacylase